METLTEYYHKKLTAEQAEWVRFYIDMAKMLGYQHAWNCIYHALPETALFTERHSHRAINYFMRATEAIDL